MHQIHTGSQLIQVSKIVNGIKDEKYNKTNYQKISSKYSSIISTIFKALLNRIGSFC